MVRYNPKDLMLVGFKGTLPRPVKIKRTKAKVTQKESTLQALAEEYLDLNGVDYIRIPDSLLRAIFANPHISPRDKAFISSYIKGLPDITCFHPKIKVGRYPVVLPIELKTEVGKVSASQRDWQSRINTVVARGWDEIKKEIDDFINLRGGDSK